MISELTGTLNSQIRSISAFRLTIGPLTLDLILYKHYKKFPLRTQEVKQKYSVDLSYIFNASDILCVLLVYTLLVFGPAKERRIQDETLLCNIGNYCTYRHAVHVRSMQKLDKGAG